MFCLTRNFFQVRVNGIPYVGIGNSTNKKDAQTNAAYDFANYLVRAGKLSDAELPSKVVSVVLDCVTVLLLLLPPRNLLYTPLYIHIQYIDCSVDDLDDCL